MIDTRGAERQAAFKMRQRATGKKQITIWVTSEQEKVIKAILAGESLPVTPQQPEPTPPQPEPEAPPRVRFVPVEPGRPERLRQYEVYQGDERLGYVWQTVIAGRKQWQGFPSGFNSRTYTGPSRRQVVERIHRYRQL